MFPVRSHGLRWSVAVLAAVALITALLLASPSAALFALLPETAFELAAPAVSARSADGTGQQRCPSPGFSAAAPARAPPA